MTDNEFIYNSFLNELRVQEMKGVKFNFFYSSFNTRFIEKYKNNINFRPILLKKQDLTFFNKYDLFLSLHCKQIFPDQLVQNYRCINVHPGLNPYNRGWFPQVFSIINKLPVGVTIHEMDCELDHGPVICQKQISINNYDTSFDVYQRILNMEIQLLHSHLQDILSGNYCVTLPKLEGNINYKEDFNRLCKLDLNEEMRVGEMIDLLRATTFGKYDNAYFLDDDGKKIYVSINLKKEQ